MEHPNIHKLTAVKIKPETGKFSMISEMMTNGNIFSYVNKKKANRIILVRAPVIVALWNEFINQI